MSMRAKRPLRVGLNSPMMLVLLLVFAFMSAVIYLMTSSTQLQKQVRQRVHAISHTSAMGRALQRLEQVSQQRAHKTTPSLDQKWRRSVRTYRNKLKGLSALLQTSSRGRAMALALARSFASYELGAGAKGTRTPSQALLQRGLAKNIVRLHKASIRYLRTELARLSSRLSQLWDWMSILALVSCGNTILVVILYHRGQMARRETAQLKEDFVSNVSHELRTPLTAVRGAVTLLRYQNHNSLPGQADKLLDIANRNCLHLSALIDDLLDVQKLRSGAYVPQIERCDLLDLINQCTNNNHSSAQEAEVTLVVDVPDEPVWCDSDPKRFRQIIDNLLSNAIKFSPAGKSVNVRLSCEGERIRIEVKDEGPGVPLESQKLIFERFTQTKEGDGRKGTGLGLNICKMLTERLGGEIGVESTPGQGSTFFVIFALSKSA